MLVRAPLVEAKQDGSIRIQDLTKVVITRRRLRLAEERLVPFDAARNVPYPDDRPWPFQRILAAGLTRTRSVTAGRATLSTLIQRLSTVFSTPSTFTGKCALQNCSRGRK